MRIEFEGFDGAPRLYVDLSTDAAIARLGSLDATEELAHKTGQIVTRSVAQLRRNEAEAIREAFAGVLVTVRSCWSNWGLSKVVTIERLNTAGVGMFLSCYGQHTAWVSEESFRKL